MDYYLETPEHKANVAFLKRRIRKGEFWQVSPFGYVLRDAPPHLKTQTYRGSFSEDELTASVNFICYSNGAVEAKILTVKNNKDPTKPTPILESTSVLSETSAVEAYKRIQEIVQNAAKPV